jgi:hypothetical protein
MRNCVSLSDPNRKLTGGSALKLGWRRARYGLDHDVGDQTGFLV